MTEAGKPEQTAVNGSGTGSGIDTPATQWGSRNVLEQTRRDLIVMRAKHGAESPIGYRCSNLVELMQMPEIPTRLVTRQMADLQRLLAQ